VPGDKEPYPVKRRVALVDIGDEKKTRWKKGHKARLYGLWRLPEFKERNEIILVEGESDTQTCWLHNFPALGLPGAGGWNEERDAALFDGIATVYAIIEPDQAAANLLDKLARSAIRDRLRIVRMRPEIKDPSALYLLNPEGFAQAFRQLLDAAEAPPPPPEIPDPIDELNKTYAVIRVVNRAAILNEHLDAEGLPTFSLLSKDSFTLLTANRKAEIETVDKVIKVPVSSLWLADPRRREYEGITFAPQGAPPGYYNLWRGLPVAPSQEGSCELFKEHLFNNVCDGRSDWYKWVFGWFADIFRHPTEKCGTSLVLRGGMGVGKTIVGKHFGKLLGLHYCPVADPRYVIGRFNAHLVRCLLFHVDEGFWAGDRAAEGKLKDLVTGERHPIELKGYEVFFVPNYVRPFILGNPNWLVPAGMDERRFATFDVAENKKENTTYFAAIEAELRGGGYQRLLHELLHFDLSTVDLRHIPKTEALLDQKIASLSAEDGWWFDILKRGRLPYRTKDAKPGKCPGQMLYDDYIEHAQKQGARRRAIETALGIFLNKTAPGLWTAAETFTVKDGSSFEREITNRGAVYTFPPLDKCRAEFEKKLHQLVTWDEPLAWVVQT
jgi:hypothetical protein